MNNLSSTSIETAIAVFDRHSSYFGEMESREVAEALRELLALREAGKEPVAWLWRWSDDAEGSWRYSEDKKETHGSVTAKPLYAAPQLPAVNAAEEKLKRLAVILSGSDAPGEIRSLTVTAQSYVDRCQQLAKDRELAPQLPAGWVMVPKVPTEDMVINGFESDPEAGPCDDFDAQEAYEAMSGCQQAAHRAKLCWAAMIAAAPKPGGNNG